MKTYIPKGWTISYNPKPIPSRSHDYDFSHENYDGENGLCGTAADYHDALMCINEILMDEKELADTSES